MTRVWRSSSSSGTDRGGRRFACIFICLTDGLLSWLHSSPRFQSRKLNCSVLVGGLTRLPSCGSTVSRVQAYTYIETKQYPTLAYPSPRRLAGDGHARHCISPHILMYPRPSTIPYMTRYSLCWASRTCLASMMPFPYTGHCRMAGGQCVQIVE